MSVAKMKEQIELSIIVLTYNKCELTHKCLQSIEKYVDIPYQLIIIDNHSTDETVEYLKNYQRCHQSKHSLEIIYNSVNVGFGPGVNIGLQRTIGKYVCLLNNDAELTKYSINNMIRCLISSEKVQVIGPLSSGMYEPQYVESQELLPKCYIETTTLFGFCCLFYRNILLQIGGIDERYEIGNLEELDFFQRIMRIGGKMLIDGYTFIPHQKHASWTSQFQLQYYHTKNRRKFIDKWGYDKEWDKMENVEPTYYSCLISQIVILSTDLVKNQLFIEKLIPHTHPELEWIFIDEMYDEATSVLINNMAKNNRVIHVKTCYHEGTSSEDKRRIGLNNAFGSYCNIIEVDE